MTEMFEMIDDNGLWLDDENPHQFGLRKVPTDESGESTYILEFGDESTFSVGLTGSEVLAIKNLLRDVYKHPNGDLVVVNEQD